MRVYQITYFQLVYFSFDFVSDFAKIYEVNSNTRGRNRQNFAVSIGNCCAVTQFNTRLILICSGKLLGPYMANTAWNMTLLDFGSFDNRGGAGTAGNPVQVGNTTFMQFIKCQPHIITMLLPHKLLILLYYLDNICWWRCQCRLIRNASIVCHPLAPELSA